MGSHHRGRMIAEAASLFQATDPKRSGKRLPAVLRALAGGDDVRAEQRLLVLESGAGVHRFRRRLANAHLPDDVVLATATLLARAAARDLDRQGRVELLLRRLLVVHGHEGKQVLPRDIAMPIIERVAEGAAAPEEVREKALAFFHDAVRKLHACETVEEVFSKWVLADVLGFKATLGADFRDPTLLYASIAFSVEVENRLALLASTEDIPAGDVSYRLWKMELELRTMFRRAGEADRAEFQAGAFEKIDWRRFKWRQGLGRLRDRKVEAAATRTVIRRRTLLLAMLAALALGIAPTLIPDASTLQAAELDLAKISPVVESSFVSGDAMVLVAKTASWSELTDVQREAEAAVIASRLAGAGVKNALVQSGGATAIRIEQGRVAFVEMKPVPRRGGV